MASRPCENGCGSAGSMDARKLCCRFDKHSDPVADRSRLPRTMGRCSDDVGVEIAKGSPGLLESAAEEK